MNILHIDSSSLGGLSVTRELTAETVRELVKRHPDAAVTYRDLAATPPSHLGGELLRALRPNVGSPDAASSILKTELAEADEMLKEFLRADLIVVGAPMYNFSIPSQLKAWIDRLALPGKTFRYTANGPEGLVGDKTVVVVSSRGGAYAGMPFEAAMDHQEAYLRATFGFFGIKSVAFVRAEGVNVNEDTRKKALERALRGIHELDLQGLKVTNRQTETALQ